MAEDIASAMTVPTLCVGCSVPIHSTSTYVNWATCLDCARTRAGCHWSIGKPLGDYHPTVDFRIKDVAFDPWAVTREPFPVPVTTSRQVSGMFPTPPAALKLAELAREHSWEVRTQYSRGHMPHAGNGRPGVLKDLIGLRFGAHPLTERQAYAVCSRPATGGAWTWGSVMIWGPDLSPFAGCGITELKEYLSEPDIPTIPLLAWVELIKKGHAERVTRAKAKPKAVAKPREGMS